MITVRLLSSAYGLSQWYGEFNDRRRKAEADFSATPRLKASHISWSSFLALHLGIISLHGQLVRPCRLSRSRGERAFGEGRT